MTTKPTRKASTWTKPKAKGTGRRPPPVPKPRITPRAALFIERYLVHLNATWAAREAGYGARNATKVGWQLLREPLVAAAVNEAMDARVERTQIDQDFVLNGLADEATFKGLGASHQARVNAFELLGRHVKMFPNRIELTGEGGGPLKTEDVSMVEAARRIAFVLARGARPPAKPTGD